MLSTGSSTWTSCNETPETCIVDSPSSRTKLQGSLVAQNVTVRRKRGYATEEIVPDSEEDRFRSCVEAGEVIVISSDSEQEEEEEVKAILDLDVAAQRVMSTHQSSSDSEDDDLEETPVKWTRIMSKSSRRLPAARRIIEDSESEVSEPESPVKIAKKQTVQKLLTDDIIELTSSSEDDSRPIFQPTGSSHEKPSQEMCPSYLIPQDDGAILIFDEPRSAKKPVRVSGSVPRKRSPSKQLRDVATRSNADIPAPSVPLLKSPVTFSGSSEASPNVSAPVKRKTPGTKSTKSITRVSKKALEEAERARRENYAQELFNELNRSVFKNGLPEKTKLNWNKRLLTTAGKAKYHRSRDGVETSEIELATKILDCDERIRNTLSHEMCHLATWVIDKKLDENHGKLFKHWASKVTRRRSDIEITAQLRDFLSLQMGV
ncbi:hypothetical protein D9756_003990 [Leucocoprinus leucothites]|uniref:SprT-like domain-containing protein n=1 Tax=Leucocoprinus leucothites TaxID=201217 RepID=A0A8H5DB01_9AGAR|nr:hypothetical protein D9756_003990 [Leucoagaricus leucothites]